MSQQITIYQRIKEASQAIRMKSSIQPQIGIILGSGLGTIAERATDSVSFNYSDIPHFHGTSVEGHEGKLQMGKLSGVPVVFLKGRFHVYEGYPMDEVVFPTRVICALGIHTLIVTNAAGGINTKFRPGDLMQIEDHINLMGENPLKGKNLAELGPRFPDLTEAYNRRALETIALAAKELDIPLHRGIYSGVLGPTYETPAEIRMLRILGADAVGMSTVPEVIAANHLGVQVAGFSCITNLAAGISLQKLTHQEVIETSKQVSKKLADLLEKAVPLLANHKVREKVAQL